VPIKYHIHTKPARPRVRPVGKLGIVDWREDCSNCHNCVKRACVYGLYRDESERLRNENGYLDYLYQCKGCLSCIQNCTKNLLTRVVNPEYRRLGDDYFTPDIILTTWYQSETGSIPVSGSGYGGPFSGNGFDSMWTDMSEIVRPTRDGIHGREYINTGVDIGRKLSHLSFHHDDLDDWPPPLLTSPLPIVFDLVPERWLRGPVMASIVKAATKLGVFVMVQEEALGALDRADQDYVLPVLDDADAFADRAISAAPMVMVRDRLDIAETQASIKSRNPDQVVGVRVPTSAGVAQRVVELAREGAEVINLLFDPHGREQVQPHPRHMRDVIREVHGALVRDGARDQVTLISSGGIAMAEHVTKAIICGVDLVAIDLPLMVALECRLCGACARGEMCPIALEEADPDYAVQRVVNLMGAWHSQLIEMLGAMGIREVRRLRGETGRCMFFEDLERNTFGRLFGKRKEEVHVG
jgi:ferredoxin